MINKYFIVGCIFWGLILFILFCIRPKAKLHVLTMEIADTKKSILTVIVLLATILCCILPMGQATTWNGETPGHEKQYEYMAESILDGHLYLDHEIDSRLLEMENPYDVQAREELNVKYEWDHSFYNGRYYMYFGVVPVFLLFLPYRIITGVSLAAYHATQIFTAFFIIGIFAMFHMLAKRFFSKISLGMYLSMSVAFSVMSVWYSIGTPVLYCTAITAALCMEIWSLYFFIRAVWIEEQQKKTIIYAFFGSLFGALAFGCRPSIALANLLVLPMLVVYLQKRKINLSLIIQLTLAAMPYFIIGILLMVYNYARFDNPFEFGQSYQLTIADLSNYGNFFERFNLVEVFNGIRNNFFECNSIRDVFPYFTHSGVFINYPILFFSIIGVIPQKVRTVIKENNMKFFVVMLFLTPVIITGMDVIWTAYLVERYKMDIYWLLGILCFVISGFYYTHLSEKGRKKFSCIMSMLSLYTALSTGLYFLAAYAAIFSINWPGALEAIQLVLRLGIGV